MSLSPLAGIPTEPVQVPPSVTTQAAGATIEAVWRNTLGGLTFRLGEGTHSERFIKWVPLGTPEIDLAEEASRLLWARNWTTVPEVIDLGSDDSGTWLVTKAMPGSSAVNPRWLRDPHTAVVAIGTGLRAFHDSVPAAECPYDWSVTTRRPGFEERLDHGNGPSSWSLEHQGLSIIQARRMLADVPDIDRLVVCHGDACAPNTLLTNNGRFLGHVDLGSLGTADRWADLAVAAWSTEWNYGPGYDNLIYEAYGIKPDPKRIRYYKLLWDLT